MATQLDEFPAGSSKRGLYPWDTLLDGQVWEAKRGTEEERKAGKADFSISAKSFRSAAQQAAGQPERGGKVETKILDNGNRVVLRFFKPASVTETPGDDAA